MLPGTNPPVRASERETKCLTRLWNRDWFVWTPAKACAAAAAAAAAAPEFRTTKPQAAAHTQLGHGGAAHSL